MGEDAKSKKNGPTDPVVERAEVLFALLERISDRKKLEDTQSYADLKGLKDQMERPHDDPELVETVSSALNDLTQRIVSGLLEDKRLPKVKVTKMIRKQEVSSAIPPSITGWEVYRPRVGKRYKVFKVDGGIFMTSPVTKVLSGYVQTKNSVYQIEVLREA